MSSRTAILWELRSPCHDPARCVYQSTHLIPHLVTVAIGDTEMVCEPLGTEAAAFDEASYLFDDYLLRGWTELIYCDSRLPAASPLIALNSGDFAFLGANPRDRQ